MTNPLALKASALSRRIYASLPWGYRVAQLFEKLAADPLEAFSRFIYAEFLKAGVQGMPVPDSMTLEELTAKAQGAQGADRLPRGYGRAFGQKVWAITLRKYRDPEIVEDALSAIAIRVTTGKLRVREGTPLTQAESFVITSVLNAAMDAFRASRRRDKGVVDNTDEAGNALDINDPKAFEKIDEMLPAWQMARIMEGLKKVHERAPSWVEAQLEGLTGREIASEWGVSPQSVSMWESKHVPKIKQVMYRHLSESHPSP